MVYLRKIHIPIFLSLFNGLLSRNCDADPGQDFNLCNPGPGLTQIVRLDATNSMMDSIDVVNDDTVSCYDILYKWTLLGDTSLVQNFNGIFSSNPVLELDLNSLADSEIFQIELEISNDDFCTNKDTLEINLFAASLDVASANIRTMGSVLDGRICTHESSKLTFTPSSILMD